MAKQKENAKTKQTKLNKGIRRVMAILLALLVWQIVAMCIHQRILLVTPIDVFVRLCTIWQMEGFVSSILFTFSHIVGGFLLGLAAGILLASLAYFFPIFEDLLWPWMATARSVPVASFVVICLIWLSSGNLSVFISFLIVVPIIYQNTLTGLRGMDRNLAEMAEVFHMPWYRRLRYLTIPQLAPHLLSACTVTAGMAWKAGIAAEVIGTPNGSIGRQIYLAKIYLDTDDLLAWTVIIVILSVVWEKVFLWALRKIFVGWNKKGREKIYAGK